MIPPFRHIHVTWSFNTSQTKPKFRNCGPFVPPYALERILVLAASSIGKRHRMVSVMA
ncbi:hypothetical protein Hanom_Chr17g01547761 [Helianthus anomalus]